MNLDVALVRASADRSLPKDLLVREPRPSHRPQERFAVRIRAPEDVARLRAAGLPLFLVRDDDLAMLGYPMRFPPIVAAARTMASAIRTDMRIVPFNSARAARDPRLEDIVVAVLAVDPVAARALLDRNRDLLDPPYLTKRIYQEDLERAAGTLRILDFPVPEEAPPREAIERLARANRPRGILP